ncbi:hypothetical protein CIPAW_07G031100 [Carya illinoinensis]|uniref:Uncharacterized protein n=1 Tax=Carya illinoinensis TaxID=32201 RepID=A0A8T1Q262_CARIL|nr:hypothetical protein CIPAW_07G031100 [Carya illinoinensis]
MSPTATPSISSAVSASLHMASTSLLVGSFPCWKNTFLPSSQLFYSKGLTSSLRLVIMIAL